MIIVGKLFSVGICFFLPFVVFGAVIDVYTPDSSDYIIIQNLTNTISDRFVSFKVVACKNAYVGLISGNTDSDPLYEIVIGYDSNTKSHLRIGRDNSGPISEITVYHALRCYLYTYFFINWNDTAINVFIRPWPYDKWYEFLKWTSDIDLLPILNVGICTMGGSSGLWQFYTSGKPKTSDETTALLESTTLNLTRPPSTITDGKSTHPLTYTSTDSLTIYDETTQLPQTTRPDNMTTTSEDLPYRITNDDTVISDTSSASTSTKSTAMTLNLVTTPSSTSISVTKPGAGTFNSTCTCNCLDVQNTADNSVLVNQLKIDKKTLSSYKRKLQSATDPRKSSLYIGCVGIVVFSVIVAFIVLLDFLPSA